MANLTPEQLEQVEQWAADGANLNEIQSRLKREYDINLTYLDARLLMLEVGVRIKDKPRPVEAEQPAEPASDATEGDVATPADAAEPAEGGTVTLTADTITIPGALISGKVTFSDGTHASWFLDQMGRLGLNGVDRTYQPPAADVPIFQRELDRLLQEAGL